MSEIPEDIRKKALELSEAIVPAMCMTWDHSYGLQTPEEREGLERSMGQIAYHEVRVAIAKAIWAERQRAARIAEDAAPPVAMFDGPNAAGMARVNGRIRRLALRISQAILSDKEES